MATITGLTAERMLEIEGSSVVDGEIINGDLIFTKFNGETINAGQVQGEQGDPGPVGPMGPASISAIPGEVKLWPGSVLPAVVDYGKWVWADGAVYAVATYPKAAAHIATQWRTFAGASDPGASNFRVPDLRGLVAAGLDQMPGGSRANRLTRSVSIVLAGRTGEEIHTLTVAEMPAHSHNVNGITQTSPGSSVVGFLYTGASPGNNYAEGTSLAGGGGSHENLQPTVFVPYIVKLDD